MRVFLAKNSSRVFFLARAHLDKISNLEILFRAPGLLLTVDRVSRLLICSISISEKCIERYKRRDENTML